MTETGQTPAGAGRNRGSAILWTLGIGLGAMLMATRLFRQVPETEPPRPDLQESYRRELHSYLWGIGLALTLTGVPFGLVYWSVWPRFWLFIAIGVCALVQIIVHFRFFLHVSFSEQKREDLQLILFSTLILATMAGGTIWILDNLALRMH